MKDSNIDKKIINALQESQDITLIENTFDNIIEMTDEELDKVLLDNADFIVKWCDTLEEITKQQIKNGVLKGNDKNINNN